MSMNSKSAVVLASAAALAFSWMGLRTAAGGESDAEKQTRLDRFDQGPATIDVSKLGGLFLLTLTFAFTGYSLVYDQLSSDQLETQGRGPRLLDRWRAA